MENYEEKLLSEIDSDIRSNAELVRKRVQAETDYIRENQLSFYKEGVKRETEVYLENELKDLELYAAGERSKNKLETKKRLLEMRRQYTDEIFADVKKDLQDFVKSDQYNEYLRENLKAADIQKTGYFEVRENDVPRMKKLLDEAGYDNPVKTAWFGIGGFRYIDQDRKMEFSCALDEKLAESRKWFADNSGFSLSNEEGR